MSEAVKKDTRGRDNKNEGIDKEHAAVSLHVTTVSGVLMA